LTVQIVVKWGIIRDSGLICHSPFDMGGMVEVYYGNYLVLG